MYHIQKCKCCQALFSMQKVVRAGNTVVLDEKNPHIRNIRDGTVIELDVNSGVYTVDLPRRNRSSFLTSHPPLTFPILFTCHPFSSSFPCLLGLRVVAARFGETEGKCSLIMQRFGKKVCATVCQDFHVTLEHISL